MCPQLNPLNPKPNTAQPAASRKQPNRSVSQCGKSGPVKVQIKMWDLKQEQKKNWANISVASCKKLVKAYKKRGLVTFVRM